MQMIKKWGSYLVCFLAGFLAIYWKSLSGLVAVINTPDEKITQKMEAGEILTDKDLPEAMKNNFGLESEFSNMKTFSLILTIVALLLMVFAVVAILKKLDKIKFENTLFQYAGVLLMALFLIAAIGVLITSLNFVSAYAEVFNATYETQGAMAGVEVDTSVKIGTYQPVILAVAVLCSAALGYIEYQKLKD